MDINEMKTLKRDLADANDAVKAAKLEKNKVVRAVEEAKEASPALFEQVFAKKVRAAKKA